MKVTGFDGKVRSWAVHNFKARGNTSGLHANVRKLLKKLFPYDTICEELTLPGSNKNEKNGLLFADFFVPTKKMIVEAHGEQHYKYNSHFFKTKQEFFEAKTRDSNKKEWCEMNDIVYVELSHKDSESDWEAEIVRRLTT